MKRLSSLKEDRGIFSHQKTQKVFLKDNRYKGGYNRDTRFTLDKVNSSDTAVLFEIFRGMDKRSYKQIYHPSNRERF